MAPQPDEKIEAVGVIPRRLFYYNGGFLRDKRLRRILQLCGHELCLGRPTPEDGVVVWGRSPYAQRGERVANRYSLPLVRLEDAFLRSVKPGRMGGLRLGLMIDTEAVHFDSSTPSRLERILASAPLDHSNILQRARDGMARIAASDLSKYNIHEGDLPPPAPGYVLIIDQTRGDASIHYGGASAATFAQMLAQAREDHPQARIVIKSHPETANGLRGGHFHPTDADHRTMIVTQGLSPKALLEGAIAVYTVTSQMGFEAILAGHRPVVFGQPFYAGWGLSTDIAPIARRTRRLTRTQLFAASMILAPSWYDPCRDQLCSFEQMLDQLEAETRALREDRHGYVATGMRLWKRGRLQAFFGSEKPLCFIEPPEKAAARKDARSLLIWGNKSTSIAGIRVEDGFLRSRGLGAELIPPLSLVCDDLGIYYDPGQESRLERLITMPLPPAALARAQALQQRLIAYGLSKYNLAGNQPDLPEGLRILVPGQVENDASLLTGTSRYRTNLELLQAARAAHPEAVIVYKPHPDVEAGLRPGAIAAHDLAKLADVCADHADPIALIKACDEVWTLTSLLGFEALLRGKPVTTLGAPFYAGWGLTHDLGDIPHRRLRQPDGSMRPRPSIEQLIYATLIAYPRYYDPISRLPCPPEVVIERLAQGSLPRPGITLRLLAKAQGYFASHAQLWR